MAFPAAAIVGGAVTFWLAMSTADGLVADDYYKQGLAINQVLHRDDAARRLGYAARAEMEGGGLSVRVSLWSTTGAPLPAALHLHLAHPTRSGMDQHLLLKPDASGAYRGDLLPPGPGHWRVTLEDEARSWRLSGGWQLPEEQSLSLTAAENHS